MNKKLLALVLLLILLAALVLVLVLGPADAPANPTEPTDQTVISATEEVTEAPTAEPSEIPTEETIPGEPDPYGDPGTVPPKPGDPTEAPTEAPVEETLPGDVDVSLGVVPGEETPDLDEDGPSNSGTTQQPSTQQPSGGSSGGDAPVITEVTYETYIGMSGDQQQAFIDQFASVEEFVKWYNASKEKYEAEHPDIEIGGDTVIDGSQLGKS